LIEGLAIVPTIRVGSSDRPPNRVFSVDRVDGHSIDVLRRYILTVRRDEHAVNETLERLVKHNATLDEFIPIKRENTAGNCIARGVPSPSDPLEQSSD
jgi:hypothetical protein